VLEFLAQHQSYILVGHEEPDGDCIAAQLALASYLQRRGRSVHLCSDGPFNRPEIAEYAPLFEADVTPDMLDDKPAVVVLDCSTPERTGSVGRSLMGLETLVVDHHSSGSSFGDLRFVEPTAPASALLVQLIIEADGGVLKRSEAQLLLFGMCTDTGFFRHLDSGAQQTFAATARLVAAGGDPRATYERIYGNRSFERRLLLGKQLQRAEWLSENVLYAYQTVADLDALKDQARGNDDLYALLRSVAGADVVAFAREERNGECSVSLRSSSEIDVGAVALDLGGGGHRQAAGFSWPGSLRAVRTELRTRLRAAVSKAGRDG
jgi:phosphoesterase RecJ-like protein